MLMLLPIFVPNDSGLRLQLDSINTATQYLQKYENIKRIYAGWCAKEEYWTAVKAAMPKDSLENLIVFENNVGKAHIVNTLFEKYEEKEEFFFTYDSDICFQLDQENIFSRLKKMADKLVGKNLGLISLNLDGQNSQFLTYQTYTDMVDGELISWALDGRGLAGGALFISSKAFREVGKYKEFGAYGSDDGFLMNDLKTKGYFACCARDIYMFHPAEELKPGYSQLKLDLLWHPTSPAETTQRLEKFWREE